MSTLLTGMLRVELVFRGIVDGGEDKAAETVIVSIICIAIGAFVATRRAPVPFGLVLADIEGAFLTGLNEW